MTILPEIFGGFKPYLSSKAANLWIHVSVNKGKAIPTGPSYFVGLVGFSNCLSACSMINFTTGVESGKPSLWPSFGLWMTSIWPP